MKQRLSTFLHDARARANLSQKDVADFLGYNTYQVVSDWERGLRSPPAIVLKKLVNLYKVPMEEFFELLLAEKTALLEQKLSKSLGFKRPVKRRSN